MSEEFRFELNAKEWEDLLVRCLLYLGKMNPDVSTKLFVADMRPVLPDAFGSAEKKIFCFAFKGRFLPSGNLDGRFWKPSQGTKERDSICKRYFYTKDQNAPIKLKRQVIWLKEDPDWHIVEYSNGRITNVSRDNLEFPLDHKLLDLIQLCHSQIKVKAPETLESAQLEWDEIVAKSDKEEMERFPFKLEPIEADEAEDPFNTSVS